MPREVLAWAAVAALLAGVLAWAVATRGRRALARQAAEARAALAVAESRLADLAGQHASLGDAHRRLGEEHLAACGERERLRGDRDNLGERLARLEAEARASAEVNRRQTEAIAELAARASAVETERNGLRERLEQQQRWVEEQTRAFEQQVLNATNQLLEEKSRRFTELNRKEIDAVVAPFKEQLGEFRQRVDSIYAADSRDRGALQEQVAQLARLNQAVSQRAEDLTRALTQSSKTAGDWGEVVLARILEDSGLSEGREYALQHTVTAGNERDLQRPDAVIFLPEGRQVVVDAKVSNKAWTDYCAATDEEARAARLAAHLASLRAHVKGLAARDYPHSPDLRTVEFVLMFVPVEAALLTAFARDEALYGDAYRSGVVLVTPSTLMAVLKLVEGMWAYQRRKESADQIAEAGRKLYEKLTTFAATFVRVGEAIERAHGTFEEARGQLATGKGNAIRLAQRMVELGVTPAAGKALPAPLLELSEGEEGEVPATGPGVPAPSPRDVP